MEEKIIKTFEEKKRYAEIMRNIFCIMAVLYIGLMILLAWMHRYEILWWALFVCVLYAIIAVMNQSDKEDAELVLEYMESRNYPWISVNERLPKEDTNNKGYSVEVLGLFPSGKVGRCYYSFLSCRWYIKGFLGKVNPTHWMPISKV